MLPTVKVALPALVMVSVAVAVAPVVTLPKAKLPLSPTIRVTTLLVTRIRLAWVLVLSPTGPLTISVTVLVAAAM